MTHLRRPTFKSCIGALDDLHRTGHRILVAAVRRRNLDHARKQDDKDSLFVLNNFHFMIDFRLCAFLGYCMKLPFGHVSSIIVVEKNSPEFIRV